MARRSKSIPIPARRGAPNTAIDGAALRVQLTAIAEAGNDRGAIVTALKAALDEGLGTARELFDKGRLGGLETARLIAAIHDEIVTAIWDYTTAHVVRAANPTESERVALCAVGGYGRGEMAPFSDLDLLFLTTDKKTSAHVEQLTEFVLYLLWDLGFKVGHAVRTPDQAIKLAREDQTILTALLDLRFLRGDEDLAEALHTRFRREVAKGSGRAYIQGKLAERDARHEREGNSRYVIEPNVKEGKGGLRDLHVLYWIARFLDRDGKINDPQRAQDYVGLGLFDERAAARFRGAADFLWRTRINLHWSSGRASETLSFDRQVELCRLMGYASGPVEVAVERFMREYFTNAKEVGALTRIACAKLEEQRALRIPTGLYALIPGRKRNLKNPGLKIDHGRLNFADPMQLKGDPSLILQLFETAGRRNLDIHPDALSAIDFRRNLIDADFRRSPINAKIFCRLLLGAQAPYATLKLMNEAGVLGRYLSEFGGIVGRTQFNMHHAYTVDEHTLRLIDQAKDLIDGRTARVPLPTKIAQDLDDDARLTLYLTCLLHDTGKGQGDQCIEGAQLARRACRRMGIDRDITDTVAWLVRSHLTMSETAQRRDISDPETIAEFAELVGSQDRLDLLYVLTVCDIRSVGPGVWNDWKGTLLDGLYAATSAYLDGRTDLDRPARAASIREQLIDRLPSRDMAARVEPILEDLGPSYWLAFDMADLLRHARFVDSVLEARLQNGVQTRVDRSRDTTEMWVLTLDRPGLFADLTHAIASCGASIAGARLHTGPADEDGLSRVFNVFYLQNSDGLAFGRDSDHARDMLHRRGLAALQGTAGETVIPPALKSRRAGAIPVTSQVRFSESAEGETLIIEVEGRDRPGLLAALACVLRDHDLDVLSAHIEVVGTTAIDAFYVRPHTGGALSGADRASIDAALQTVLTDAPAKAA